MIQIVWRFRAKPEKAEEFRRIYASDGEWARLFSCSAEYRGTSLLQDSADPLVFLVMDRWAGSESFARFREQFGGEYDELDRQCLALTAEETKIGVFSDEIL